MSSKAFYKSSVPPRLVHRFVQSNRPSIEIWITSCIVTNFGKTAFPDSTTSRLLVNPANPELSGVRNFPYFPKGGPVPRQSVSSMHKDWQPLGYVSNWGGMEVGSGMLYAVSVVDGLVHQLGGWQLQAALSYYTLTRGHPPCPTGTAVMTTAADTLLLNHYDGIIHTAPPFYNHEDDPERKLGACYQSALQLALNANQGSICVALPLVGAGARGFPVDVATNIAGEAVSAWCRQNDSRTNVTLAFGLLEEDWADQLAMVIKPEWERDNDSTSTQSDSNNLSVSDEAMPDTTSYQCCQSPMAL